ncbi:PQQ-binding-like beta-propeller repeat protein [Streptomyces sp. NRRL S-118]|uniref:outer membrane protein assembly factor BamB family protein n=1 Tax=Streptomyces sp. NRRL S-118 TaxID=1463881 RepID=UPI000694251A|nr:PQQ-binding-like beta-propeller repeat protein [Streptomyces sp. NRRL S-118]
MEPSPSLSPSAPPPSAGDPGRVGPYTVLARFRESAGAVQYVARDGDGARAVVTVPRPELAGLPAFRRRFVAEYRLAELLAGRWVPQPLGIGEGDAAGDGEGPGLWTATAYVPALTLGEAVALAGPLPEKTVRVLGAGLAESLSRVHATGTVLHGLAPDTVLLAADGPRLTAFGALGAAAAAEARPGGQLSVRLGYLTPEQAAGEEPGPSADVFVLGLLLAYAATGTAPLPDASDIATAEPDLTAVPEALRPVIAECLAKAPGARPTASRVATALALEGAASLARPGWLPDRVVTAIGERDSRTAWLKAPADRVPEDRVPDPGPRPGQHSPAAAPALPPAPAEAPGAAPGDGLDARTMRVGRTGPQRTPGDRVTTELVAARPPAPPVPPTPPAAPAPAPAQAPAAASRATAPVSRRALFTGAGAGLAGAVLGGGVVAFASGGEERPAPKPAARRRPAVPGLPPEPRWAYTHEATPRGVLNATVWRERTLVLTSDAHTTAVDLTTGRRLWRATGSASAAAALPAGDDLLLVVTATEFQWLSPKDGTVAHRAPHGPGGLTVSSVAGQAGTAVWFTATAGAATHLVAYDAVRRKELWRAPVPAGRPPHTPVYAVVAVRPDGVVVRQDPESVTPAQRKAAKGLAVFTSYDRVVGKRQWFRPFGTALPTAPAVGDASGRLFVPVGDELHAYDTRSRALLWRLEGAAAVAGAPPFVFGGGALHDTTLYVANRSQTVYAVDPATGRPRWQRGTEAPPRPKAPQVTVGAGGRVVLAADGTQVTAFGAADGRRLWKFQDAGVQGPGGTETFAPYTALAAGPRTVVVRRDRTFYALPVG